MKVLLEDYRAEKIVIFELLPPYEWNDIQLYNKIIKCNAALIKLAKQHPGIIKVFSISSTILSNWINWVRVRKPQDSNMA